MNNDFIYDIFDFNEVPKKYSLHLCSASILMVI